MGKVLYTMLYTNERGRTENENIIGYLVIIGEKISTLNFPFQIVKIIFTFRMVNFNSNKIRTFIRTCRGKCCSLFGKNLFLQFYFPCFIYMYINIKG